MQDKSSVVLTFTYNKSENRKKGNMQQIVIWWHRKVRWLQIYEEYQPWRKLLFWPRPWFCWFCCYYCYDLHPLTCQLLKSEGLLVFPVSHCKFRVSLIFVGLCMLTFKKLSWRHWPKIFAFLWHFSQSELSEDYRRAGKLHIEIFGAVSLGFVMFFLMLLHC